MSTTPDVRPGDSASPSNLLVLVPSVGYDEDDICNELLDAPDAHAHELLVTCLRSPVERLAARDRSHRSAGRTTVIDVETDSRSSAAATVDGSTTATVEYVPDATDLVELGERIDAHLTERPDEPTRLCVHSLTALLGATDTERLFKFLDALTRSVDDAGAVGHYHMDPDVHDPATVATLEVLFDAVVDLRDIPADDG
jgi:hypothetical protein